MQITPIQNYNINSSYQNRNSQPNFTGSVQSKLFKPLTERYNKLTDFIAEKYYGGFYKSKFARWFTEKTDGKKWAKNMTTHMSALGATLISGMYVVRTLENDKLDKEKRKTLAINDALTWALSTAGAYWLDARLGNWCEGITTRFVANYVDKHPEARNEELLGKWNPKNIYQVMEEAPQRAIDMYNKKKVEFKDSPEKLKEWMESVKFTKERHFEELRNTAVKSVRDFNLDILKNERLTTMIEGIGVLKTLFVFGMVYRYLVPVLVMKPANKLGNYIHQKQAEKQQAKQTQQA